MKHLLRRYWLLSGIALLLALATAGVRAPQDRRAPATPPSTPPPVPGIAVVQAAPQPTSTATATPAPTATPQPAAQAGLQPTPSPRPPGAPLRVGLQAGHWKSNELPDELAMLRRSTGTMGTGIREAEFTYMIATHVAALLRQVGIEAEVLPATVPPGYDADAFVAIHADGSRNLRSHGFKLATPWRTSRASQQLLDALAATYAEATGMPRGYDVTINMKGYYAFDYTRFQHAIARTTPAVIVETGFMTSADDRDLLFGSPEKVTVGIANGIIRYLNERNPADGAALLPPDYAPQRPRDPAGLEVRAEPRDDAKALLRLEADQHWIVLEERDGWLHGVPAHEGSLIGWVRADQVEDAPPAPPATH